MGELFLARMHADSGFNRLVVIKRILPHLTDKKEFVDMFVDEARVAAQIHHPNVCQILEFGQIEGRYYMALEYLEGVSMTQVIVAGREFDDLRTLRFLTAIMTQVCEGLHFAHNLRTRSGALAGVVHRDVNPKNIFVTSAGVAKVIDFGIVKALGAINVTRTGSVKGTYSYMSPEQIKATAVDRRSDVFSLGTVTWEAITGVRLFKRDNDFHTWRAITEDPIPPPSQFREGLPSSLDKVLAKALERDKEKRYATTHDLALALEQAIISEGGPLTTVGVASRLERAFEAEIESQRQRSYAPSVIEDGDDEAQGFEISVEPDGAVSSPLTSSAHRASAEIFQNDEQASSDVAEPQPPHEPNASALIAGSDLSHAAPHQPLGSTPITGSDLSRAPHLPHGSAPITGSGHGPVPLPKEVDLAAPTARTLLDPAQLGLAPVTLSPTHTPSSYSDIHQPPEAKPKKRLGVLLALGMIAAVFTLAAVLYVTRNVTRNVTRKSEPTASSAASEETEGTESGTNERSTSTAGAEPTKPADADTKAAARVAVERREDPTVAADLERQAREKEAAEKAAQDKEDAEAKKKEKREKEEREKEEREKEEREKEEKRQRELAALPPGSLSIDSHPFGTVTVDGKKYGQTPVIGLSVKPGLHRVVIESGAGTYRQTVRVESGKLKVVRKRFKDPASDQ